MERKHHLKPCFSLPFIFSESIWEKVCSEKAPFLTSPFFVAAVLKSHPVLQDMVRTLIYLPFQISVQAWVPSVMKRAHHKPLRSDLLQQMRVCKRRAREERAARPGFHHTRTGCSVPFPSSWDQIGQTSMVCGAKAQGSSLGWKYSVNITIQICWASGLLEKCQRHSNAQCTKSLSASIGNISGALAVFMLKIREN